MVKRGRFVWVVFNVRFIVFVVVRIRLDRLHVEQNDAGNIKGVFNNVMYWTITRDRIGQLQRDRFTRPFEGPRPIWFNIFRSLLYNKTT